MTSNKKPTPELSKTHIRPDGTFLVFMVDSSGDLPTSRASFFSRAKTWASYFFNSKNFVW